MIVLLLLQLWRRMRVPGFVQLVFESWGNRQGTGLERDDNVSLYITLHAKARNLLNPFIRLIQGARSSVNVGISHFCGVDAKSNLSSTFGAGKHLKDSSATFFALARLLLAFRANPSCEQTREKLARWVVQIPVADAGSCATQPLSIQLSPQKLQEYLENMRHALLYLLICHTRRLPAMLALQVLCASGVSILPSLSE
jgi:hypothetical protein